MKSFERSRQSAPTDVSLYEGAVSTCEQGPTGAGTTCRPAREHDVRARAPLPRGVRSRARPVRAARSHAPGPCSQRHLACGSQEHYSHRPSAFSYQNLRDIFTLTPQFSAVLMSLVSIGLKLPKKTSGVKIEPKRPSPARLWLKGSLNSSMFLRFMQ